MNESPINVQINEEEKDLDRSMPSGGTKSPEVNTHSKEKDFRSAEVVKEEQSLSTRVQVFGLIEGGKNVAEVRIKKPTSTM